MKIVFRVDASTQIGSGHVMRCLALANTLQRLGHNISFACLDLPGNFIQFLEDNNYSVLKLPFIKCTTTKQGYESWLTRSETRDAQEFLRVCFQADCAIVDHYGIETTWESLVKEALSCKIVAIDDLVRPHTANLIIDQTLSRKAIEYDQMAHSLCGQDYALLSGSFCFHHERALDQSTCSTPFKVLVSFGAIDEHNFTLRALEQLSKLDIDITVLLSTRSPHYAAIANFAKRHQRVTHISFTTQMAELMLQHDIAIGAPGTTSWERACLGLPSIIIPIADNQLTMCEKLSELGVVYALKPSDLSQLGLSIKRMEAQWQTVRRKGLAICDGLGAYRSALAIHQQLLGSSPNVQLRRATKADARLVYEWQQHPETRRYALNSETPSWTEHSAWFTKKLEKFHDYFYIAEQSNKAVGVVRLDRQTSFQYLISIYVAPSHYGQGIGSQMLTAINMIHPHIFIEAVVLEDNKASQRLFEKAGYDRVSLTEFTRPPLLEESE